MNIQKPAAFVGVVVLLWLGLRWFERANLYAPSKEFDFTPAVYGMPFEDVQLVSADGVRLHGWYSDAAVPNTRVLAVEDPPLPKVAPLKPGPQGPWVLVVFHGNAGNIGSRIQKLRIFRGMGLSVLLFDYRGYGKSEGRPTEKGTYLDGAAAVGFLEDAKGVPRERMVYYGESLGCAVALQTALDKPPKALILDSGFTSTVEMGKLLFPFLPVGLIARFRYDNIGKIPGLKVPLLVMHSPQDDIVPFAMGRKNFEAATGPKRFAQTQGDHNEGFLDTPDYGQSIRDFIASLPKP
ncbi:MAG: alpha/beta hydrolase [Elusimicrobiota bacterium]